MKRCFFLFVFFLLSAMGAGATALPKKHDIYYGQENAPIKIIQYTSPSCHYCGEFMEKIFPQLDKEFIQTGQVILVVLDFPLNDIDMKISQIIRGSSSPSKYQKIIYDSQFLWTSAKNPLQQAKNILIGAGMTRAEIVQSVNNRIILDEIIQSRFLGEKKYDISGVPVFIVGAQIINGLESWAELKKVIQDALNHVKSGKPLETFGKQNDRKKITT
ncbi:MAG: thioredoxin domain-containing protein [Alphaproteobacteria bacterium]